MTAPAIRVGCDIVYIPRFKKVLERTPSMRARLFLPQEAKGASLETMAGIFAAKEAVTKALGLKAGAWHEVKVVKGRKGRPTIRIKNLDFRILGHDVSISHDGDYAIAVAIFLLR